VGGACVLVAWKYIFIILLLFQVQHNVWVFVN
jgi:hypothetical protein